MPTSLSIADLIAAAKQKELLSQQTTDDELLTASKASDSISQANELLVKSSPEEALKEAESKGFEQAAEHIQELISPPAPKQHFHSLAEKLAAKKAAALEQALAANPEPLPSAVEAFIEPEAETSSYQGQFSLSIELNEKQLLAKEFALKGKNFCLIGAAGTGKTTTQRSVAETLLESDSLSTTEFKIQGGSRVTAPSIAFVAYTRRASANLQRAIHKNPRLEEALACNVMTIHALLEFIPVTYLDDEGKERFRFEPQKTASNPLSITHLVIEEASMVGLDLWRQLYDALPSEVQIIFIGDINQLPPVFGASILNYALVQLPIVELDKVYRQADDSTIIENAHKILRGDTELKLASDFQLMQGNSPVQVGQEKTARQLAMVFKKLFDSGDYNPDQDMILSPYNKQPMGTINLNRHIAQFLGAARDAEVWEIIAGFNTHYLAVGDRVMYNKQDCEITAIGFNSDYCGSKTPQMSGRDLTRFGGRIAGMDSHLALDDAPAENFTLNYSTFSVEDLEQQDAERKQQASHCVKLRLIENPEVEFEIKSAGDFQDQIFSLGYALTVHKAQGCEWRNVYICLHKEQHTMIYRELIYTAVTRSRERCILISKKPTIDKAITNPRIKGNTIADKIEYFNRDYTALESDIVCET